MFEGGLNHEDIKHAKGFYVFSAPPGLRVYIKTCVTCTRKARRCGGVYFSLRLCVSEYIIVYKAPYHAYCALGADHTLGIKSRKIVLRGEKSCGLFHVKHFVNITRTRVSRETCWVFARCFT